MYIYTYTIIIMIIYIPMYIYIYICSGRRDHRQHGARLRRRVPGRDSAEGDPYGELTIISPTIISRKTCIVCKNSCNVNCC